MASDARRKNRNQLEFPLNETEVIAPKTITNTGLINKIEHKNKEHRKPCTQIRTTQIINADLTKPTNF